MTQENATAVADAAAAERQQLEPHVALFAEEQAGTFRRRWNDVQAGFVDEPRAAVQTADALVSDVLKQLSDTFARERAAIEQQWNRGDNIDTEDLRLTLRRYRSFFDRLLSM
jgi:hypothetical protein